MTASTSTPPAHLRTARAAALLALALAAGACREAVGNPPDEAAVRALLAQLDRDCNAGDLRAYTNRFDTARSAANGPHLEYVGELLVPQRSFVCTTSLQRHAVRHERTIALIRSEYRVDGAADAPPPPAWDGYLVLRGGAREPRIELAVRADPRLEAMLRGDVFLCTACNYSVGAPGPWLAVPIPAETTGCMENVAFYNLAADLHAMVSAWVGDDRDSARDLLAAVLARRGATASPQPWLPRAHAAEPPADLDGARCTLESGGRATALHLVRHGPVLYLLAVEGSTAALADHAIAWQKLVDSFRLVRPQEGGWATVTGAARAHLGAEVAVGNLFHHSPTQVQFRGPLGWQAQLLPGPHLFRVGFRRPDQDDALWATALRLPAADRDRRRSHAAWIVTRCLADHGLEVAEDTGWTAFAQAADPQAVQRRVRCTSSGAPASVHAIVSGDLLLLFDWSVHADAAPAVEATLASLRW